MFPTIYASFGVSTFKPSLALVYLQLPFEKVVPPLSTAPLCGVAVHEGVRLSVRLFSKPGDLKGLF